MTSQGLITSFFQLILDKHIGLEGKMNANSLILQSLLG